MRYLFPPRPKSKTTPNDLSFYEGTKEWVVQRKFNGSRNLIFIDSVGNIEFFNRHGGKHTHYIPSKNMFKSIKLLNLELGKEYILDGELMNKQKGNPEMVVLYDVLMCGRYFFSYPKQEERLNILYQICKYPKDKCSIGYKISNELYLAEYWTDNFKHHFEECINDIKIEGLMLRKKLVGLDNLGHSEYETSSLIRCRKPVDKGYNF